MADDIDDWDFDIPPELMEKCQGIGEELADEMLKASRFGDDKAMTEGMQALADACQGPNPLERAALFGYLFITLAAQRKLLQAGAEPAVTPFVVVETVAALLQRGPKITSMQLSDLSPKPGAKVH